MNGGIKWILIDPYIPANSFGIISIKNQSRLFYYKQNNFNFETKTPSILNEILILCKNGQIQKLYV